MKIYDKKYLQLLFQGESKVYTYYKGFAQHKTAPTAVNSSNLICELLATDLIVIIPPWWCNGVTHLFTPCLRHASSRVYQVSHPITPPPQDWPIRVKHRPQPGSKGVSHQIHPVAGVEAKCHQTLISYIFRVWLQTNSRGFQVLRHVKILNFLAHISHFNIKNGYEMVEPSQS